MDYYGQVMNAFNFNFTSRLLKTFNGLSLYEAERGKYIVHSKEGVQIACYPWLCGHEFDKANRLLATKVAHVMNTMGILEGNMLFLNVLRAAPGYRLKEALLDEGVEFEEAWVRPFYAHQSFRAHGIADLVLKYETAPELKTGKEYTLIKPDTEATGNTSIFSINWMLGKCKAAGCRISTLVLYGFISERAIKAIEDSTRGLIKEVLAFAIEDITPLAENGYDMPLYGLDYSAFETRKEKVRLAAWVPHDVFKEMYGCYYPGMDQPGDWSERQVELFDGTKTTKVDLSIHLRRSAELMKGLRNANLGEPWYGEHHEKIYQEIYHKIEDELAKLS